MRLLLAMLLMIGWVSAQDVDPLTGAGELLQGIDVRLPGSPGSLELEERLLASFAASGVKHGSIAYSLPALEPGKGTLEIDGKTFALWAMHPSLMRPGNFAEDDFETRLVYVGRGTTQDLQAMSGNRLDGAVAVMEYDSGTRWMEMLRFGVKGVIFLGDGTLSEHDTLSKIYASESPSQRFYVGPEESQELRSLFVAEGKLTTPVVNAQVRIPPTRWRRQTVRNVWAFVPGNDPDLSKKVVVLTAPIDSNSLVPGMANDGASAMSIYLLERMARQLAETPAAHSVLLVGLNGHTQGYAGERQLAWNLLVPRATVDDMRGLLANYIRLHDMYVEKYSAIDFDAPPEAINKQLIELRTLIDGSTGRRVTVKEPIVALVRRDVNETKGRKLQLANTDLSEEEKKQQLALLNEEMEEYVRVLMLFNRVGRKTEYMEFFDEETQTWGREAELIRGYVQAIIKRYGLWGKQNRDELDQSRANTQIRDVLEGRPVSLVINIGLNWEGNSVAVGASTGEKWPRRVGINLARIARQVEESVGAAESAEFVDALTNVGGLPERYYLPSGDPGLGVYHASSATPAVTICSPFMRSTARFVPGHDLNKLDPSEVSLTYDFTKRWLLAVLNDDQVTAPSQLVKPRPRWAAWASRIEPFKFDEFSATVLPELPLPGSMVVLSPEETRAIKFHEPIVGGNVINAVMKLADDRASEQVVGLTADWYRVDAFQLDSDWRTVDHAIDIGDVYERVTADLSKGEQSKRLAMFRCKEMIIPWRDDSASVGSSTTKMDTVIVLDAKQNSIPRKFGAVGLKTTSRKQMRITTGPVSVFTEVGMIVKLVSKSTRLVVNGSEEFPLGTGFEQELTPDFYHQAAHDMGILNEYRLDRMEGVTNQLARDFLERGKEAMSEADNARAEGRYVEFLEHLYVGLGAQAKAYSQISQISNDMLKAVVFYVALLIPFCFFMQKLCFKFVRVEAQMATFVVLFILSFFLFRMIHPAFKIAEAAEAIFVAFVMGALGLFVINVLHRRFEGEMQALFQTYLGAGAEVAYSTVGQKAMLIGVNNMKRRRIRTMLTTTTIVLITFAMLAFSSVSKKSSPTIVNRNATPPYTGIFYQWPGSLLMEEYSARAVEGLFSGSAETVVIRRWVKEKDPIRIDASTGVSLTVEAGLGLQQEDFDLLAPEGLPILPGGQYFSSDDAREVLLPSRLSRALEIDETMVGTAQIKLMGRWFTVVGILDDVAFEQLKDLNGLKISPIKELAGSRNGQEEASKRLDPTEDSEGSIFFVDTSSLVVMPVDTADSLGGQIFSVSVKFADSANVWGTIDQMLTAFDAKFFVGSRAEFGPEDGGVTVSPGTYYVGSGYKTSIGGLSRLLIPLLIAGTIILNTMLGSVYERKYEIAVYNAIGLNPTHIRMFFLAEAFVYSVIGSVGGYLIGQILAIVCIRTGLVGDLNLNFSSLVVLYVIAFTIAIVLLSTIYPAYVATRLAVPSGKRKWSLPDHDGKTMEVIFPFIYQEQLAVGILSYVEQYFGRFTEASMGDLIARMDGHEQSVDEHGRPTWSMTYDIALAPFDLGVTQSVHFDLAYEEVVQSYRLTMTVTRNSGQDTNWVTTNKPFLERLRKYLIQWRNMKPAEHMEYVVRAEKYFKPTVN